MTMSSSYTRPFGAPSYPDSPSAATASSVNYSQYGGSAFSPSRQPQPLSGFGQTSGRLNAATSGSGRPGGSGGKNSAGKTAESREIARVHFKALKGYLMQWLDKETPTSRASAREKLTRLTKLQFQELSTDVYDELMRRLEADRGENDGDVPFLPVRDDFHPKRNQARQKLATLPRNRFKDLASDVFFELNRRFPEFEAEHDGEDAFADPPPAPGPRHPFAASSSHLYPDQPERSRMDPTPPPIARLNSASSSHRRQASRNISGGSSVGSSGIQAHRPRPSRDDSNGMRGQPTAATSDMVVPNKSRMREEEIEVPYARDSMIMDEPRAQSRSSNRPGSRTSFQDRETPLGSRQDSGDVMSPASADDREYYDRMSFSSNVTNKSKLPTGPGGWSDDMEQKIRSEYELKIAGLERRIQAAERDRDEARRQEAFEAERRREMEDEIRGLKERATTHASSLRSLQHELDIARDAAEAARAHGEQNSRGAEEEVEHWRNRCESLEDELRHLEQDKSAGQGHEDGLPGLKAEMRSLVDELNSLSMKNDELMAQREQDAEGMDEMEAKVLEYKKKYDSIRIELRNLKATSTMFISKPFSDDHLPASADGNIEDIHVSAFQTAIDGLLSAARSSAPSGVLPAMKAIVEAVTEVGEDVKAFEAHPNIDVDVSRLESLKHESTTRLNTLMQAARNHAMASGLSPVSLLDAAAGHLTSNVVEIIKLLKIKRSDKNRELRRSRSSLSIKDMVNRNNSYSAAPPPRDVTKVNGDWDREYGMSNGQGEERLQESPIVVHRPTDERPTPAPINTQTYAISTPTELTPASASGYMARSLSQSTDGQRQQPLRINSYQSASSQKSDSFDLERKASVSSNVAESRPMVERNGSQGPSAYSYGNGRGSHMSPVNEPMSPQGMPYEKDSGEFGYGDQPQDNHANDGADEREWEDLKPYLNTQSSALVNSIQNLLAAIRTSSPPSVLNEHLSEVVAIASSIVAVSSNALPASLRQEGDGLLKELIRDTDRLSEAQGTGVNTGEKGVRQQIASASFGVAKSLKALMKLGSD